MVQEPSRLVDWAIRLRCLWFKELEQAFERTLPGAGEALVQAGAAVDRATGALHVRMPSIHPVLPPVYDVIQTQIASTLWDVFGNPVSHRVTFGGGTSRRKSNGLSVYDAGDPSSACWPVMISSFRDEVLRSNDPAVSALFSGVSVTAVSLDHVWLKFATLDARRRLGQLPGAATGLNDRLHTWNGGVTVLCYIDDAG